MNKPNLFEYLDIQLFLMDVYKYRKQNERNFSYDVWVDELGFKSRGHLRSIVIGEMQLSENLIQNFIDGFKFDKEGAEYFSLLTKYSTAVTAQLKETYGKALIALWKIKIHQIKIEDIAGFLSDSMTPVVFTYLSFEDSSANLQEMTKHLGCEPIRIQNALKCLIWQKLIDGEVSEQGEIKYRTVKPFFKIPDLPNNKYLETFHKAGLKLAEEAAAFPAEQRKFYSSFVALSPEQFEQAQSIIQECNDRILSLFESPQLNERKIYRMNVQVFPVSGARK